MVQNIVTICAPNFVDSTYNTVSFSGGGWETALPLNNLATDNLSSEIARSTGVSTDETWFEVDLGSTRDILYSVIPWTSLSRAGQYRVRYAESPRWADASVNANASAGASSFVMLAGSSTINLEVGDAFRFAGHEQVYTCQTDTTILPGNTASVDVTPVLAENIVATEEITCVTGDYTTPVYDSGYIDSLPTIYPPLFPYWGHESFWDGKPSEEQRQQERYPLIVQHEEVQLARYVRWDFSDTGNTAGYIDLPRLIVTPGWQPPYNCNFGSVQGFETDTSVKKTLNGRRVYDERPVARTYQLNFSDLSVDEIYSNAFDFIRQLSLSKQVFVIFDPTDTVHLHRRAFTATISELPAIQYDYFGGPGGVSEQMVSLTFNFVEVVA